MEKSFSLCTTNVSHIGYAKEIGALMARSAKERGTGIAERSAAYIEKKILEGNAIIALSPEEVLAGFCYIEKWEHGKFVANSGLIIQHQFRNMGLAKKIKKAILKLSKQKYPKAKIFGITTSFAVMKINSELGYKPVTFSELTNHDEFWNACKGCKNYDILQRNNREMCLCTAMVHQVKENKLQKLNKQIKVGAVLNKLIKSKK